jgi:hypothetical protein
MSGWRLVVFIVSVVIGYGAVAVVILLDHRYRQREIKKICDEIWRRSLGPRGF